MLQLPQVQRAPFGRRDPCQPALVLHQRQSGSRCIPGSVSPPVVLPFAIVSDHLHSHVVNPLIHKVSSFVCASYSTKEEAEAAWEVATTAGVVRRVTPETSQIVA